MRSSPMVNVPSPSRSQQYKAPEARYGRSQFSLAHRHKTAFNAGELIPFLCAEVIPGDTFTCKMQAFARVFSPLDAPIMDDIEMDMHYFFVPNRIIWDNWTAFLGEHDAAGAQDTDYTIPVIGNATAVVQGVLADYFGLPIGIVTDAHNISALPFRAYRMIYDEWYRDQNLIDEEGFPTDNGPDLSTEVGHHVTPLKSAKKPDYFTTALPYLQKGDIQYIQFTEDADIHAPTGVAVGTDVSVYSDNVSGYRKLDADTTRVHLSSEVGAASTLLYANLTGLTGISVNALRESAAIQRQLEREARGGTRHPELIRSVFGVDVPDYRTQRPEYLGGGKGYINVSPVPNTSSTATEDQGQLAGIGTGGLRAGFAKSFVEHGYVLGILRARGEISYQQGLDRMWTRSTKYDFLWPELAHLGEQEILNRELWIQGDATDDNVFGYQERYADYRFKKSLITSEFSSLYGSSLDFWHLSEEFGSQPSLNQTFIEDATPMVRVTTVDTQSDFIIDGFFDLRVARVLPVRPTPSLAPARF